MESSYLSNNSARFNENINALRGNIQSLKNKVDQFKTEQGILGFPNDIEKSVSVTKIISGDETHLQITIGKLLNLLSSSCLLYGEEGNVTAYRAILSSLNELTNSLENSRFKMEFQKEVGSLKAILTHFAVCQAQERMYSFRDEVKLDEFIHETQKHDPQTILAVVHVLIENKNHPVFCDLIEKNVWQTKILSLYEKAAEKYIERGEIQEAVSVRLEMSKIQFSKMHPLANLSESLRKNAYIIETQTFGKMNMGACFNGLNTGSLKGSNLEGIVKKMASETGEVEQIEISFDVNPAFRGKIDWQLVLFESHQELYKSVGVDVEIKDVEFYYLGSNNGVFSSDKSLRMHGAKEVNFKGLGSVLIGADPKSDRTNYNRIRIRLDPGKKLEDLQIALVHVGLGALLGKSSVVDEERMKLHYLFRAYYPAEAMKIERASETYDLSIQDLKEAMISLAPGMEQLIESHLPKMGKEEIFPGKIRMTIPQLVEEVKAQGGVNLTHSIGGKNINERMDTFISVLKGGIIASLHRFQSGALIKGQSSRLDHLYGAGDSVFTQLTTQGEIERVSNSINQSNEDQHELSQYGAVEEEQSAPYNAMDDMLRSLNSMLGGGFSSEIDEQSLTEQPPSEYNGVDDTLQTLRSMLGEDTVAPSMEANEQNLIEQPPLQDTEIEEDPLNLANTKIVLRIKLDVFKLNPYQEVGDAYGTRVIEDARYSERENLMNFIKSYDLNPADGNEVMFKNRISPNYFESVEVDPNLKKILIERMEKENLLTTVGDDKFYNGIHIDDFFVEIEDLKDWVKSYNR